MSPRRGFDSFLVATGVGTNRKFRRMTAGERWCIVAGVWAIAAESPIRGYLLISETTTATAQDYADQAGVSLKVAENAIAKARDLGMLVMDAVIGCEYVHDWGEHQPDPRPSDSREAWRDRKRKSRARHAGQPRDVTPMSRDCHAPEVEVEETSKALNGNGALSVVGSVPTAITQGRESA